MRKYHISGNRISYLLAFFFIGCAIMLSSCEREEEFGTGAPVIERVRLTDPTTADSSLSKATLGSTLAIVGKNLGSAQYVTINEYRVNVNPTYATDTHLIVSILDSVPTIATNPDVPNNLTVYTRYGQATYQFQTLPPAPVVDQISNQFARAGESITLYGRYFFFVDTITFPGNVKVTDFTAATNGSSITVTVPEGFNPAEGDIHVTSQSGTSVANRATRFYNGNNEGIISNFDDIFPWGWGLDADNNVTTTAPGSVIQPIDNRFALVNMNLPANWGWSNDKVINLVDWDGAQIYPTAPASKFDPGAAIGNFDARMEIAVATAASLDGVELQIFYQNQNNQELTSNVPLKNFIRSTDGKWYTVSIPLNTLAAGNTRLARYGDILQPNKDGQHHFRIVIINTTPNAIPVTMAIDNVRIVNAMVQ
jgi:hypothetical protein